MSSSPRPVALLILLALSLVIAHLLMPPRVQAEFSVKDRDYQIVTAKVQAAGDGIYIADNRTGLVAVFTYDMTTKSLRARAVRPMSDVFTGR